MAELEIRLLGVDGRELRYSGYKRQRAPFVEAIPSGPLTQKAWTNECRVLFPEVPPGEIATAVAAMLKAPNGGLAQAVLDAPMYLSGFASPMFAPCALKVSFAENEIPGVSVRLLLAHLAGRSVHPCPHCDGQGIVELKRS